MASKSKQSMGGLIEALRENKERLEALKNQIRERIEEYKLKKLVLQVHPFIEAYLKHGGWKSPRRLWSKELKCKIEVSGLSTLTLLQYAFFTEQGEEIPV